MISNNPYSLPERPSQKSSTIYSQQDSAQFRKSDSTEFSHKLTSPSQYINRTHHPPIPSSNNALKKSTINLDETIPSYRPPPYQNTTQNVKNFLQSPKNNPSSTFPNLNNYNNLSGSRGAIKHNSPGDRKQSVNMAPLRESFGIKILDSK